MTKREMCDESSKVTLPPSMRSKQAITTPSSNNNEVTSITSDAPLDIDNTSTQQSSLNFSTGVSAECLSSLLKSEQLMEARERIKLEKAEGEDLATRLRAAKRIMAGFVWKEGTNRLGKIVFEVCKEKQQKQKEAERKKIQKEERAYLDLKQKADALLLSGKQIEQMNNKELSVILKLLKRNGDKRLLTKKNEMLNT